MNANYEINIHLKIELELALFSNLEHFKFIALIKILLLCAVSGG